MEKSSSTPLLSVRSLRIGFAAEAILPPISFELKPGDVCSIVGHNGSGKSTLLRTLLGLQAKVGGDASRLPGARWGYVPQRQAMDPIFPVRVAELVETGRYGIAGPGRRMRASDEEKVRETLRLTRIEGLADRLFRTLSGGEQQRALLARALCVEPSILVLDEPTASMDERAAVEAMELTLSLARRQGAAVLMVNHFLDLVAEVSNQVVLLDRDHQQVQVGAPADILPGRGIAKGGSHGG